MHTLKHTHSPPVSSQTHNTHPLAQTLSQIRTRSFSLSLYRSLHTLFLSFSLSVKFLFFPSFSFFFPSLSIALYTLSLSLRVEFLFKTHSGYPKDMGVNKPLQPLGIPFAFFLSFCQVLFFFPSFSFARSGFLSE